MARIRTVKPEFWQDEDLASVSDKSKLLAIGLLNHSDDEGYFKAHPALIMAAVFPFDDESGISTVLLRELSSVGYLELFQGLDGKQYGQILNFTKHQTINKPKPSKIGGLRGVPDEYGTSAVGVPLGKERKGKERNREQGGGRPLALAVTDKFKMTLDWQPPPELLEGVCMGAGVQPSVIKPELIASFKNYWVGEHKQFTERQWVDKLIQSHKRELSREVSHGPGQQPDARQQVASALHGPGATNF